MLPRIPEKLWKIDDSTVGDHFCLAADDQCYYIWEYTANKRFDFSPTNQLIVNLKIKPRETNRAYFKKQAIDHAAQALRSLVGQEAAERYLTFVPVPGSKALGHPDFDDRMLKVLNQAFQGRKTDIRPMLELSESMLADHEANDRIATEDLLNRTRLNEHLLAAPRSIIVIVDDVLNSGKHFKVAKTLISRQFQDKEIRGLFLARCIRNSTSAQ